MLIGIEGTRWREGGRGIDRYTSCLIRALAETDLDADFRVFTEHPPVPAWPNVTVESPRKRLRFLDRSGMGWYGRLFFRDLSLFHFPNAHAWRSKYCPTVVTVHDITPLAYPDRFFRSLHEEQGYRRNLDCIRRNADRVITDSVASAADLVGLAAIPRQQISVVPLGVDPAFFSDPGADPHVGRTHGLALPYLLFVGGRDYRKNLPTVLQALALVRIEVPGLMLAVVGGNPGAASPLYPDLSDDIARLGLEPCVRFTGTVDDAALRALYRSAAALVFPSLKEGFGLPILEAMASGTPVVTSNVSSLPEVAGDAALLVDPLSPDAIAAAVARVLLDPVTAADLSSRGRARARDFTWERTARQTMDAYRQVCRVVS